MLKNAGIENCHYEALVLTMSITGMTKTDLLINRMSVADEYADKINNAVIRRIDGEPLQYITGVQEFMSLDFFVDKSVLIPRQDTETLVETVINEYKNSESTPNLLDICTGSGAIAVSLAHYLPAADITALDISTAALAVAKKNAEKHNLEERIEFKECDILTDTVDGVFDAVISNPPYIRSGVLASLDKTVIDYEPHIALDGGADGLIFFREIAHKAVSILKPKGMLAFETGYDQGALVSDIMRAEGFDNVCIIKDLAGCDRVVKGYRSV